MDKMDSAIITSQEGLTTQKSLAKVVATLTEEQLRAAAICIFGLLTFAPAVGHAVERLAPQSAPAAASSIMDAAVKCGRHAHYVRGHRAKSGRYIKGHCVKNRR